MSRPEVRRAGMTVVELLVGLAILGVVLFAALSLLTAGQDVTSFQQRRTLTLDDARAAMSRVVEVGSQASYVYPAGLTLTTGEGLRGARSEGELTTGRSALALLVWDGRSTSPPRYHAVVFYVADRARFAEDLPGTGQGSALVEATTEVPGVPGAITWPRNAMPPRSWSAPMTESPLADGIDAASSSLMLELADGASFAGDAGQDDVVFTQGVRSRSPRLTSPDALITSVAVRLAVNAPSRTSEASSEAMVRLENVVSARNVPRP